MSVLDCAALAVALLLWVYIFLGIVETLERRKRRRRNQITVHMSGEPHRIQSGVMRGGNDHDLYVVRIVSDKPMRVER